MRRLIITGGAGFIGSHLVLIWLQKYPHDAVLNLDKLSYASNQAFLKGVQSRAHYRFEQLDLCERNKVRDLIRSFDPDGVIHLAAESHVDNSILDAEPFISSNIVGTFNLLEECRQYWQDAGVLHRCRFHHVSTDEVFGAIAEGKFTEASPYRPNSPYAASKAASDHLVRAYHETFGMDTVITNCSNNFGPNQHDEKLIPTVIRSALHGKPIPVYGNGENVRDWLFVEDHCAAIELAFQRGRSGASYNIGARNEWRNIDLVRRICDELNRVVGRGPGGDYKTLIHFVTDRPGHDRRYAIDPSKIERELKWAPESTFDESLARTVQWYVEKYR